MSHEERGAVLTILNRPPQPSGVLFRQAHDPLGIAVAQRISLFDTVDESIMHDQSLRVETDEILIRPVGEVQRQSPG